MTKRKVLVQVSTVGVGNATVLAALFNRAPAPSPFNATPMTPAIARRHLAQTSGFGWICGRHVPVSFRRNDFDPRSYDRVHGAGAAAQVVAGLRKAQAINRQTKVSRVKPAPSRQCSSVPTGVQASA